jgi:uncharacterized membrane protein HdeD (DUF308 family)
MTADPARPSPAPAGPAPPARRAPGAGAGLARSLRGLYLWRVGFAALWIALVASHADAAAVGGRPGVLAEILLVSYPAADGIASVVSRRARRAAPRWLSPLNLAAGAGAALGILVAARSSLAAVLAIFGAWAVVSGGLMIILAVHRRALGGQWLMIVSGAGSVYAGATFVTWAGSPAAGLRALAQYSAGGALWYLLAAAWLSRPATIRRASAVRQRSVNRDIPGRLPRL